jgi:hypothetical protein
LSPLPIRVVSPRSPYDTSPENYFEAARRLHADSMCRRYGALGTAKRSHSCRYRSAAWHYGDSRIRRTESINNGASPSCPATQEPTSGTAERGRYRFQVGTSKTSCAAAQISCVSRG